MYRLFLFLHHHYHHHHHEHKTWWKPKLQHLCRPQSVPNKSTIALRSLPVFAQPRLEYFSQCRSLQPVLSSPLTSVASAWLGVLLLTLVAFLCSMYQCLLPPLSKTVSQTGNPGCCQMTCTNIVVYQFFTCWSDTIQSHVPDFMQHLWPTTDFYCQ